MSLIAWYPLNGDTVNQGIGNIVINATNITYDNNGKIGKCLSAGKLTIAESSVAQIFNNTAMSIAFWYNNGGANGSNHAICGFQGNSEGDSGAVRSWDFFNYSTKNDFHWSMGTLGSGVQSGFFPDNEWVHVCFTFGNGKLIGYKNGKQFTQKNNAISNFTFDKKYYVSFGNGSHKLNDFRIYNHCLSPREVGELAQGLILHYPMCMSDSNIGILNEAIDIPAIWNNHTIYDASGYRHNAAYTDTSKPSWESNDSPIGLGSYKFNGTTVDGSSNTITGAKYITAPITLTAPNKITIAWWGRINKYGRGGIFETTSNSTSIEQGTDYNTTAIANWDRHFRIYNGSSSVELGSQIIKDNSTWRHNVITFDGNDVKCYINGELVQTGALSGTLPTFNGIKIGIGHAGGAYRQVDMNMADFRIYATALSAEDVERLYKVRTAIDNEGNLLTTSYIESSDITNDNVTKTGLVKAKILTEEGETGKIFKDGSIKANKFYEFV